MYTYQKNPTKRTFRERIALSAIRKNKLNSTPPFAIVDHAFRIPLQRFIIKPHEAQSIVGRLGTQIIFPANAFVYESGAPVFEEVEVELKEVMSKQDAVRENLTTVINDTFQESGGMLYLNASSGGENVYLNEITPAKIRLPRSQNVYLDGTGIFTGQRLKDENINWQMTDIPLQGLAKQRNILLRRLIGEKTATKTHKSNISSFEFESATLGWMNCDKPFSSSREQTTELFIITQTEQPVEMKVVLKDHNSVLPVVRIGNSYTAKIPMDKVATVTGFYQEGEQCFFGTQKIKAGQEMGVQLDMKVRTMREIKKELKRL